MVAPTVSVGRCKQKLCKNSGGREQKCDAANALVQADFATLLRLEQNGCKPVVVVVVIALAVGANWLTTLEDLSS